MWSSGKELAILIFKKYKRHTNVKIAVFYLKDDTINLKEILR